MPIGLELSMYLNPKLKPFLLCGCRANEFFFLIKGKFSLKDTEINKHYSLTRPESKSEKLLNHSMTGTFQTINVTSFYQLKRIYKDYYLYFKWFNFTHLQEQMDCEKVIPSFSTRFLSCRRTLLPVKLDFHHQSTLTSYPEL